MMDEKTTVSGNGIGLGTLLFLIFLTLKLAGIGEVATWSWWWITSPLWLPVVIGFVFFFFLLVFKTIFD